MNISANDRQWVEETLEKVIGKISKTAPLFLNKIPYRTANGKYEDAYATEPGWWTNGFYAGMLWMLYERTGNDDFLKIARNHEELLDTVLLHDFEALHHDVGFMWHLSSRASYALTGDKSSRNRALLAAATLASRVNVKGNYIRAWNHDITYSIIDCMMNLPLLYWASRELNDDRFRYIAELHADMTAKEHIRDDGSVVHIVNHAETSTDIVETVGGQGYKDGSAWSRGQAWAVYGFCLSYIHTGNEKYLAVSEKTADYFLNAVKKNNYKILTDFCAPEKPVYYDNSAGVCAACGLIELYKITKKDHYLDGALKILKAMEDDFIFDDSDESIVQNCMVSYIVGKEEHLVYADFFLCEALLKLTDSDFLIW